MTRLLLPWKVFSSMKISSLESKKRKYLHHKKKRNFTSFSWKKKNLDFFQEFYQLFFLIFFTVFPEWFFRNFFEFFFFQFFLNGSVCFGRFCFYRILSTSIVIEWYTCSFTRRTEKSPEKFQVFYSSFKNTFEKTYTSDWMKLTFKDKNRRRMKGVKLPILCMTDWRWRSISTWLFKGIHY